MAPYGLRAAGKSPSTSTAGGSSSPAGSRVSFLFETHLPVELFGRESDRMCPSCFAESRRSPSNEAKVLSPSGRANRVRVPRSRQEARHPSRTSTVCWRGILPAPPVTVADSVVALSPGRSSLFTARRLHAYPRDPLRHKTVKSQLTQKNKIPLGRRPGGIYLASSYLAES